MGNILTAAKREYTHIVANAIHVVISIKCDTEILDLLDNCNYRSISEISSVQACDICKLY